MSTTSSGGRWPRCWVGWWWRYPTLKEHRLERIRGVLNYQLHFIIYFKLQQGQGPHSAQMKLEQDQRSPVGSSFSVFLNISYIYILIRPRLKLSGKCCLKTLPLQCQAVLLNMTVHMGALWLAMFHVPCLAGIPKIGQAIPSYWMHSKHPNKRNRKLVPV